MLLRLAREPRREWPLDDLVGGLKQTQLTPAAARKYLARFEALRLVQETKGGSFVYRAPSAEVESVVAALNKAYNERPVTLVRTIYSLRDAKLRSLADAFRLKKQ